VNAGDGAEPGLTYLPLLETLPPRPVGDEEQRIAERLHRWYQGHALTPQALAMAATLGCRPAAMHR
jgi:hypothetical protein